MFRHAGWDLHKHLVWGKYCLTYKCLPRRLDCSYDILVRFQYSTTLPCLVECCHMNRLQHNLAWASPVVLIYSMRGSAPYFVRYQVPVGYELNLGSFLTRKQGGVLRFLQRLVSCRRPVCGYVRIGYGDSGQSLFRRCVANDLGSEHMGRFDYVHYGRWSERRVRLWKQ